MTKEEILNRLEAFYEMLYSTKRSEDFYPYMIGWITGELEYILRTEGRK